MGGHPGGGGGWEQWEEWKVMRCSRCEMELIRVTIEEMKEVRRHRS